MMASPRQNKKKKHFRLRIVERNAFQSTPENGGITHMTRHGMKRKSMTKAPHGSVVRSKDALVIGPILNGNGQDIIFVQNKPYSVPIFPC